MTAVGHRLPLIGARHLEFRCNGCGDCCRGLTVSITHHDLRRLLSGLGAGPAGPEVAALAVLPRAAALVAWLAPDAVDMTGEPGTFVELDVGRRLMVLARRDGACVFLDPAQRCSVYAHRPQDCRLFPFDLERDPAGRVVEVSRLSLEGCSDERGPAAPLDELAALDARRWQELADYQALVARWNRLARHRRRFRQRPGDDAAFLDWLGFGAASAASPAGAR